MRGKAVVMKELSPLAQPAAGDQVTLALAGIAGLALFWCPVHGGEDGA